MVLSVFIVVVININRHYYPISKCIIRINQIKLNILWHKILCKTINQLVEKKGLK